MKVCIGCGEPVLTRGKLCELCGETLEPHEEDPPAEPTTGGARPPLGEPGPPDFRPSPGAP